VLHLLGERPGDREIEGGPVDLDQRRDAIVLDDDRISKPLDERPSEVWIDIGDEPEPHRGESRTQHGDANDPEPMAELASSATEDLGVRQHLGAADLEGRVRRFGHVENAHEITHDVVDGDRLTKRVDPLGRDHNREPIGESPDHLEACAPRADDDRRPKGGQVVRSRRQ